MEMISSMNRRDFLKCLFMASAGTVLGGTALWTPGTAEAYWQTEGGHSQGGGGCVEVKETYLRFRSLENRTKTDVIILHHVGNTNADVSAATIHQWHLANGWAGIGYHYVIRKDGTIERGRPRDAVGAHCYGENYHSIGINLVGEFDAYQPTAAQIRSAERLAAVLCQIYGMVPSARTIKGHRDFNATRCPGQNLYDMLPQVINGAKKFFA
jgi:N-acetylmuramoyl-L-alanine amidase